MIIQIIQPLFVFRRWFILQSVIVFLPLPETVSLQSS